MPVSAAIIAKGPMSALLLLTFSIAVPQSSGLAQTSRTSIPGDRTQILNDIAAQRMHLTADEVRRRISEGLSDPDERVRLSALWAFVSRVSGERFSRSAAARQVSTAERPLLVPLKGLILPNVTSRNPNVRYAALAALGALDYQPGRPGLKLSDDLIALLATRYGQEENVMVRNEIVKALALDGTAVAGQPFLVQALADSAESIVVTAIRGIAEHRMVEQIPRLAQMLSRAEPDVRLGVATALIAFGPVARMQSRVLRLALAGEQDPNVRPALSAAITAVERER